MTRHRFFISKEQIRNKSVFLSDDQARQIHHVLRLRQGDRIHVLTNDGWEFEVELLTINADQVTGHLINRWQVRSEPTILLTLFQSMLKQDKFEWVLQKGTEIGVTSFVPIITERTIVRRDRIEAKQDGALAANHTRSGRTVWSWPRSPHFHSQLSMLRPFQRPKQTIWQ